MDILITGASRGIGYQLAQLFDSHGHRVLAVSRNAGRLEELKKTCRLRNSSSKLLTYPFDLSDLPRIPGELAGYISKEFSKLDILVNNAGYLVRSGFKDISDTETEKILKVNFMAPARLIACCMDLLSKAEKPHVVNIGSMGGFQGSAKFAGLSIYSAAKAALSCLTECLAEEYKDTSIRFNCLALGASQTEMLAEAFPGYMAPVTASEMAGFIMNFSLTAREFINGKVIPVALSNP
jgi:3-oxoacyl-[acyl-carrier protein] reductase